MLFLVIVDKTLVRTCEGEDDGSVRFHVKRLIPSANRIRIIPMKEIKKLNYAPIYPMDLKKEPPSACETCPECRVPRGGPELRCPCGATFGDYH